jgi:hypothetical protein
LRAGGAVCNAEGVTLLDAEPTPAAAASAETASTAPPQAPLDTTPAAPQRACASCGAELVPGQDWCLSCGTAAAPVAAGRPGRRASATLAAVTALLVLGAVGAGYAAVTADNQAVHQDHAQTAAAQQAAVAAAAQTPPPAASTTTPAPVTTTPDTSGGQSAKLPKIESPKSPDAGGTAVTPAPAFTPAPATTPDATGTTGGDGSGSDAPAGPPAPVAIKLPADAGAIYDPYASVAASGEVARALDGKRATSWYVDPKDPAGVAVGYVVDVGSLRGLRKIELQTPTPGFRAEVYATDVKTLLPSITDTRWSHITDVDDVAGKKGADGAQKIVLGGGATKYRKLLLWFTKAPTDGPRIRITDLTLFG